MLRLLAFAPLPPSRVVPRRLAKLTVGVLGLLALLPYQADADEVLDWNMTGLEATAAGGQNSIVISRTMAMLHLAIHDALNAIGRRYEPYLYENKADPSADAGAAIAAAARDVMVDVIPSWGKPEQRTKALAIIEGAYGAASPRFPMVKEEGLAIGKSAAAAILIVRKEDGSSASPQYTPGTELGKWRPHPNPMPPNPPVVDAALAAGNCQQCCRSGGRLLPSR